MEIGATRSSLITLWLAIKEISGQVGRGRTVSLHSNANLHCATSLRCRSDEIRSSYDSFYDPSLRNSLLWNFVLSLGYVCTHTSRVYSSFHALERVRCEVRWGHRTKLTRARCAANHDNRATTLRTMSPAADVDDPRTSVSGRRGRWWRVEEDRGRRRREGKSRKKWQKGADEDGRVGKIKRQALGKRWKKRFLVDRTVRWVGSRTGSSDPSGVFSS